jgi:hypothetical protein
MLAEIHKELAYQVIADYPDQNALNFLLNGIAKPEWKKDQATKIQWLKEWMDMPDSNKHSSKLKNDHSYKIKRINNKFKICFAETGANQATVIARLKYSARDISEWKIEEEYRVCALELAKSIHWVIDISSPPHTSAGWEAKDNNGTNLHSKIENDFDKVWKKYYDKSSIIFGRKDEIDDIYRWAKNIVESKYDKNMELLKLYQSKGSITKAEGIILGKEVIHNLAQNLADYLAHIDKKINFDKLLSKF